MVVPHQVTAARAHFLASKHLEVNPEHVALLCLLLLLSLSDSDDKKNLYVYKSRGLEKEFAVVDYACNKRLRAKFYSPVHQNPHHKKVESTHGEKIESQTG